MATASTLPSYVELRLDRRLYVPGDLVSGEIAVIVSRPKRFDTITVTLEGKTELDVSPKGRPCLLQLLCSDSNMSLRCGFV
jgi:hypothetical protein